MSMTDFISQGPVLYVVRLFMAALCAKTAVLAVGRPVAVFHPGGAFFRRIPRQIKRDIGFCTDFAAECDEVIRVNFMHIVAVGIGLRFILHIRLKGRALIHGQEHVLPAVFAGKVTARPAEYSNAHVFQQTYNVLPHAVEMLARQHGYRAKYNGGLLVKCKANAALGVVIRSSQDGFITIPFIAIHHDLLLCINRVTKSVGQRNGHLYRTTDPCNNGDNIAVSILQVKSTLSNADGLTCDRVLYSLGIEFVAPPHFALGVVPDIRILIIAEERTFSDAEPFGRDAQARCGTAGKFTVSQYLRTETAGDTSAGMFKIMAENIRR